jgi:hypothetical protein
MHCSSKGEGALSCRRGLGVHQGAESISTKVFAERRRRRVQGGNHQRKSCREEVQ